MMMTDQEEEEKDGPLILEPVLELPTEESMLEFGDPREDVCMNMYCSLPQRSIHTIENLNAKGSKTISILVADDNPYNLFVIELLLKEIRAVAIDLKTA